MADSTFRDHIQQVKSSCYGPDLAMELGLQGRGKRFFCPSCQPSGGKTPDFSVFDQGFKCFKCGLKGDVIDLAMLAGNMMTAEAIGFLERRAGLQRSGERGTWDRIGQLARANQVPRALERVGDGTDWSDLYLAFLEKVCTETDTTEGGRYLESRGIRAAFADSYGVRFCPDLSKLWKLAQWEQIRGAGLSSLYLPYKEKLSILVFPYTRQGRPLFIKTRTLLSKAAADSRALPRFLNSGGTVPCLWNHDVIAEAPEILITEGEIDALSAIGLGFPAVGLPGWSHWKDSWTEEFRGKAVTLALDADAAGERGAAEIARRFLRAGLVCPRRMVVTHGKDLNDTIRPREGGTVVSAPHESTAACVGTSLYQQALAKTFERICRLNGPAGLMPWVKEHHPHLYNSIAQHYPNKIHGYCTKQVSLVLFQSVLDEWFREYKAALILFTEQGDRPPGDAPESWSPKELETEARTRPSAEDMRAWAARRKNSSKF